MKTSKKNLQPNNEHDLIVHGTENKINYTVNVYTWNIKCTVHLNQLKEFADEWIIDTDNGAQILKKLQCGLQWLQKQKPEPIYFLKDLKTYYQNKASHQIHTKALTKQQNLIKKILKKRIDRFKARKLTDQIKELQNGTPKTFSGWEDLKELIEWNPKKFKQKDSDQLKDLVTELRWLRPNLKNIQPLQTQQERGKHYGLTARIINKSLESHVPHNVENLKMEKIVKEHHKIKSDIENDNKNSGLLWFSRLTMGLSSF